MLHNTLSALLVSLTSRYAKLSPSDVGIGIGGGRLVIDNVELRADTFNGPHLPFHVHQGRAGRLRVNVPWRALSSTPVQLYLENVHLIAGPKSTPTSDADGSKSGGTESAKSTSPKPRLPSQAPPPPIPPITNRDQAQVPWHQTNIGRLLFNVSVEIYGLKIEYRDDDCIAIMSVASLRAFSAGPDWTMRFVSFAPDLDHDRPDATAVSMRKTVNLNGVHIVMIPRIKPRLDVSATNSTSVRPVDLDASTNASADNLDNGVASNDSENTPAPRADADHPDRNLDLNSFESKSPILDGASISLRVLLCTGATNLPTAPNVLSPGMHGEVSIEIDDPTVKLTARQLVWLDNIFKQALSVVQVETNDGEATKRRPRSSDSGTVPDTIPKSMVHNDSSSTLRQLGGDGKVADGHAAPPENKTDANGEDHHPNPAFNNRRRKRASGFMSVWEAIVGENSDETVDDAAIALGLRDPYEDNEGSDTGNESDVMDLDADDEQDKQTGRSISGQRKIRKNGTDTADKEVENSENLEKQYARRMVATAAQSGGVTWEVRLRTTDTQAWDRVHELEREVIEKQSQLEEAKTHVNRANTMELQARKSLERAESAEQRADELVERNEALVSELRELERLTGEAGRTKDEIIRQTQSALAEAETKLRDVYEKAKDISVPAVSTEIGNADLDRDEAGGNDGDSSIEAREAVRNYGERNEKEEGVLVMHDILDVDDGDETRDGNRAEDGSEIEDEGGTENGNETPNTKSEDSNSTRNSVIVHDMLDTHEQVSSQNVLEEDVAWFNETARLGSGTEGAEEPLTNVGDGAGVQVETVKTVETSETGEIRAPEMVAKALVEVDFRKVDTETRHESGKNDSEEVGLTDNATLSVDYTAQVQGMREQIVTSENDAILDNEQDTHMSNFERLQQKMGHEGLTLI